ncbi:MAG: MFS transporter [Acidobacteria bacterium]|nr:MAG: MFS transporter [Acidobacteriota bacterium]
MKSRTNPEDTLETIAYRKVTRRLIPFLFICYICAMLDRVNVSFANLQMSADLGFSATVYGFGAGIFFIGYFFFEVPSNILLEKFGARIWIARIMLMWAVISMATSLVTTAPWFYGVRFLLGVAEAGFFPGIILYLTYWYTQKHRVRMVAGFMTAIAVSNVVGGPVSGWIMEAFAGKQGLAGWQWLFILEGLPSLVVGIAVLLFLNNGPKDARWLSPEEKAILLKRLEEEQRQKDARKHGKTLGDAFRSGKVWVLSAVYFGAVMGLYGMSFWLPQIVEDMGVDSTSTIGLITAIPWAVAAVAMVLAGRHSDKTQERRWHIALAALAAAVGFVLSALLGGSAIASLAALTVSIVGVMCVLSMFWALPTALLSGTGAAAGIAIINSVGNLAGQLSPTVVGKIKDMTGEVTWGMYVLAASLAMSCVLVLLTTRERGRHGPPRTNTD